jgi:hypothetical protein|tara:strand:+ start:4384 stop:4878 length:495 start_codon:yes stop_codon:yes gene_type:complete
MADWRMNWRLKRRGEHGWEDEYFACSAAEKREIYSDFLELKAENKIDMKDELRALVEVYAWRGVKNIIDLDPAEWIALTAAYIGQIPNNEKNDIVTELHGVELPDEIAKMMGELAAEMMFHDGQGDAAKKFNELLVSAIVAHCEDGIQDEFDAIHAKLDAIDAV